MSGNAYQLPFETLQLEFCDQQKPAKSGSSDGLCNCRSSHVEVAMDDYASHNALAYTGGRPVDERLGQRATISLYLCGY